MKREQLIERLDSAWRAFQESYAGLSEADMQRRGVIAEGWTVKDVLAHVTTWEQEALNSLPLLARGEKPPRYKDRYGGLNEFNALKLREKEALPLAAVLRALEETHRALLDTVRRAPDELFTRETPWRRRLRLDTYSHYAEHTRAIRAWRERLGL